MDNFVQNLRKKLTQPQQQMRIPQPVARQVNTFVNNLNNMNFQTKRPNPVQFQAPKLEMPKIQLPKFNAIGQSRPNIPQQRQIQGTRSFGNKLAVGLGQSPIGRKLVETQRFMESPRSIQLPQVPQMMNPTVKVGIPNTRLQVPVQPVSFARDIVNEPIKWTANTLSDASVNLGRTIRGDNVSNYQNLKSPVTKLGYQVGGAMLPQNVQGLNVDNRTQEWLGNIGGSITGPLSVYGGGKAKNVIFNKTVKEGLKKSIIKSGIEGMKIGGGYGIASGLDVNRNERLPQQLLNTAISGGIGAGLGGVLGGAIGGVGSLKSLTKVAPEVQAQLRDAKGRWVAGEKPIKPPKMPQAQWEFQLNFNQKYKRNPYEPVYSSDLNRAVAYEAEKKGVGLSIRDVSKDRNPLGKADDANAGLYDVKTNDPLKISRLKTSINEGLNILKAGGINGRKMSQEELQAVARSVENARLKIGTQVINKPGLDFNYKINELSSDELLNASKNPSPNDLTKDGLRNWKILVKRGEATFENGRFARIDKSGIIKANGLSNENVVNAPRFQRGSEVNNGQALQQTQKGQIPQEVNPRVAQQPSQLSSNLKLTDAYPKDFLGYSIPNLEKQAKTKGYNLYDALIKRVDSQDNMQGKLKGMQSIMDDLFGKARVVEQPKGVTPVVNPSQSENLVSGQLVKGEKAVPSPEVLSSQIDELASGQKNQLSKSSELLPENSQVKSGSGQSPVNPPSGEIVPKTKYAFNINKDRLKMNPQQKKTFDSAVSAIKPELEKLRGKKLTFDEVREEARTAEILRKTVDRSSTEKFEAGLLATRERMNMVNAEIDKLTQAGDVQGAQRLYEELSQLIKVNSSNTADIGRKLGSFRIMAEERPFRERVLEEIIRTNKMSKEIEDQLVAKAANIDWNDARQVTKLFREFVKPSVGKMLEEYRYINLLSSPRTHITNAFSNLIQAGITRPVTKLASGIIDPVASALTGKEREFYISEVPVYYRGMIGSMPKAFNAFKNVMSGKVPIRNLDMRTLQSGTALTKVNVVSKALSGMDEFFQTIIKGGETEAFRHKFAKSGKIVKEEDIAKLANQEALYSVFRRPLDSQNASGQGSLLSWVDKGTEAILGLRRVPGVGWFIPFVQTPMNIFKQGIEYSPLGVATLKGSANKTEQLAKTMVGSTVFAGAGFLAMQDKLTWDTPKDPEAKKAFYAAGYQPYSMKIGDKWVSYSRLGPLAYPLALAAAVKYAYKDDPNAVANGDIDKITNSLTGIVGFFGDQTYVQGLGNLVKAAQGEEGYSKATATLGNVATQYVPLSSLLRWVTGVVDPVYRKSDGVVDQIKKGIPGLSTQVGFYEDPYGEPSKRQYPAGNAFSPFNVTKENPEFKDLYDTRKEELQTNAQIRFEEKRLEKEAKEGVSGLEADASGSYLETLGKAKEKEVSTKTSTFNDSSGKSLVKLEAEDKLARKKAKLKQEIIRQNGKIYVPSGDSVKVIDLNPEKKKGTGIASFVKEKDKYASAREVWNLDIPQAQKNEIFKDLGVDPQDVRYDALTGYNNEIKTQYIVSKDMTHDQLLNRLIRGRVVSVSGDIFATDGVLKSLLDQNLISGSEYGTLKKLKLDKNGKSLTPVKVGSGGSRKKVKYDYTGLASKLQSSPIKLKKTKLNKVKLGRSNSKSGGMLEGSNKYLKGFKNI